MKVRKILSFSGETNKMVSLEAANNVIILLESYETIAEIFMKVMTCF
jgi:hypothetical protein